MKRRSRAGGKASKARGREAPKTKRRDAPMAVSRSTSSNAVEETEVARLGRELREALEQQTATAEVLHLMSGSHGDLARVFDTILENATRLCQANFGLMHLHEGDAFRTCRNAQCSARLCQTPEARTGDPRPPAVANGRDQTIDPHRRHYQG